MAKTCVHSEAVRIFDPANKELKGGRVIYVCEIKHKVRPDSATKIVWVSSTCVACGFFENNTIDGY